MKGLQMLPKRVSALWAGIALAVACNVLAAPPASAQRLETRELYANSLCKHPLRLLVYHKDSESAYHPHAWYHFRPYEESRLQASDVTLRQVVGYELYIYAETHGSGVPRLTWGGKDGTAKFEGLFYSLRKVPLTVNQYGHLEFQLTCP